MQKMNSAHVRLAVKSQRGLTLIEMVIVVAIVGIIATVGWSYFSAQKRRGLRSEAVIALTNLAQMEERYMTQNGTYADKITTLNPPSSVLTSSNTTPKTGAYTLSVKIQSTTGCTVTAANGKSRYYCYELKAAATGNQTKDSKCLDLYLDHTGKHWSTDGTNTTTGCWSK